MIYLVSQTNKSFSKKTRFPLDAVLGDNPEYLLTQIASEIPQKMPPNGSAVRIKTLKQLCELLLVHNRKLDQLQDLILNLNERNQRLSTLKGVERR